MQNERFQTLHGWRGICALLIPLYHLQAYGHFYELSLIRNSWLVVDFFFVLSGFIISYQYVDRLRSPLEIRGFIVRRFARLWPLHASVLMIFVGFELMKFVLPWFGGFSADNAAISNNTVVSFLTNLFLLHSLGLHDALTWNGPSWAVSTEFYTCVFFAAIVALTGNSSRFIALSIAVVFFSCAIVFSLSNDAMDTTYDFGLFRCLYGFFVGHLTYCAWKSGRISELLSTGWLYVEIVALISFVGFLSSVGKTQWSLAAPLVFAFIVWVFAHERGLISRLINVRPLMLLGTWSYSIYMVHYLLLYVLSVGIKFITRETNVTLKIRLSYPWLDGPAEFYFFGNQWAGDGFAIVYLVCVIMLAAISCSIIEQPGRRFFNSLTWAQPSKASALTGTKIHDFSENITMQSRPG